MDKRALLSIVVSMMLIPAFCLTQEAPVAIIINHVPDGSVVVQITNRHQGALTAYLLEVGRTPSTANGQRIQTTIYFDSLLNPWQNKTFSPGETRSVRVAGPSRGSTHWQIDPQLKAAVFEDGVTFGDNDSVARVMAARKMFFEELGKAISLIQSARASGMSRDEVIREATQEEQVDLAGAQEPELKRAVANPWGTLQMNLQRNSTPPPETVEETVLRMFMRLRQNLILAKPTVTPPGATVNPAN